MREIVLDTETTGLDPYQGHRLVEIGCIELVNRFPTGNTFHRYLNPERDVPAEAFGVHGLSAEFLRDKPCFAEVADEFLEFVADAPLVAHNAIFDLGFLNAELERCGKALIARDRLVDTLLLARRKHPGAANSLDHLCVRYAIDNARRTRHGDRNLVSECGASAGDDVDGMGLPENPWERHAKPGGGAARNRSWRVLRELPIRIVDLNLRDDHRLGAACANQKVDAIW